MQALRGLRVVDLSGHVGAYCSKLLADQGADVIVVEPPGGMLLRQLPPFLHGIDEVDGSAFHVYYNANKRGVSLDLSQDAAVAALSQLLKTATIVVATTGPETFAGHFGVDSWLVGGGIWCVITPFGADGPYRDFLATHLTTHAMTGQMFGHGPAEGPPISIPGLSAFDETGQHAALCIVAALRRRKELGGQVIELAAQAVLAAQSHTILRFSLAGVVGERGGDAGGTPPAGTWECADGLVEFQVHNPGQWDSFIELLGSPAELSNPEWRDRVVPARDAATIRPIVEDLLKKRSRVDLYKAAQAAEIPSTPVNTLTDFVDDEHIAQRGFMRPATHPALGRYRTPGRGYRIDGDALWELERIPPTLGQHNTEILVEELGLDPAQVSTAATSRAGAR